MVENRHHNHMTIEARDYRQMMQASVTCRLWRAVAIVSILFNLAMYGYIRVMSPDETIKPRAEFKLDSEAR